MRKIILLVLILMLFSGCSSADIQKNNNITEGYELKTIIDGGRQNIYKLKDDNNNEFIIVIGEYGNAICQIK
jgi:uncharacterized protein YceK